MLAALKRLLCPAPAHPEAPNPLAAIPTSEIRRAEDGREILYALARTLTEAHGDARYIEQIENAAHAIGSITRLHPEGSHQDAPSIGAAEHASVLRRWMRLP